MRLEPHADQRKWAAIQFQMFSALVEAGFTEDQAMTFLARIVAYNQGGDDAESN